MRNRGLADDGILGEKTLAMLNERCGLLIMPALRSERAGYYRLVLELDAEEKQYTDTWLERAYCAV